MPAKCIVCKNTRPNFGMPWEKVANHCSGCKLDGMVDIKSPKCIVCNKKQPSFGMPEEKVANHCAGCKLDGMVNIKSPKCIVCNDKIPVFAMPGKKLANHCGVCKLDGMVDIKNPRCIVCNDKRPYFGIPGEKVANHCGDCKLDGMVNIKSPKCIVCNDKRPVFGMPGEKIANHCGVCKLDGMIDIKSPKCIVCNKKQPHFGMPGGKIANHCARCKLDDMIDIKHPKCISSWCSTRVSNPQYKGYCLRCFIYLFPDKPVARNYKTKERAVVDYIKEHFAHLDIIEDKRIYDGCSKRRPDIMIDLGFQVIIVEIDENQHNDYDCSCENKRIMELSQDVGHRPIVLIRFNPDDYRLKNGKKQASCWCINKLGICCLNKTKQTEWDTRLKCLHDTVNYWTNGENKTSKMIEQIGLYYDE